MRIRGGIFARMRLVSVGSFCLVAFAAVAGAARADTVTELHGIRLGESQNDAIATVSRFGTAQSGTDGPAAAATPCDLPPSQAELCGPTTPIRRPDVPPDWVQEHCYKPGAGYDQVSIIRSYRGNPNDPSYYKSIDGMDGKLAVIVGLSEDYPAHPCHAVVTRVYTAQVLETSDDSLHEVEDRYIEAAIARFGKPTAYVHRHMATYQDDHLSANRTAALNNEPLYAPTLVQQEVQPVLSWCAGGTAEDCGNDGSGATRRLQIGFGFSDSRWSAIVTLDDLAGARRISNALKHARAESNTPQF